MKKFAAALLGAVFHCRLRRCARQGQDHRRFLEDIPGRALEDRRSRHQGRRRSRRRQVHFRRRAGVRPEAGRRHRKPDLAEGRRHHGRRLRQRRHPAVVQGGQRRRRQDDRLRLLDRRTECALHHLRQRRRRPHDGEGSVQAPSRKATTPSSRATRAIRTPTSCSRAHGSAEGRTSTAARSRMSARPSPTAGSRTMPRRTWSSA